MSGASVCSDPFRGRRCRVLYSYDALNGDELTLSAGDEIELLGKEEEGWWRGRRAGQTGVFPSSFVSLIEESPPPPPDKESSRVDGALTAPVKPPPKPVRETARVVYGYAAQQPHELELEEGDVIAILSKDCGDDDGWWTGQLKGKIGYFPRDFVEVIPQKSKPSETSSRRDRSIESRDQSEFPSPTAETRPDSSPEKAEPQLQDTQNLAEMNNVYDFDLCAVIKPTAALPRLVKSKPTRPTVSKHFKNTKPKAVSKSPEVVGKGASTPAQADEPAAKTQTVAPLPQWMEQLVRKKEKRSSTTVSDCKSSIFSGEPVASGYANVSMNSASNVTKGNAIRFSILKNISTNVAPEPVKSTSCVITPTGNGGSNRGPNESLHSDTPRVLYVQRKDDSANSNAHVHEEMNNLRQRVQDLEQTVYSLREILFDMKSSMEENRVR